MSGSISPVKAAGITNCMVLFSCKSAPLCVAFIKNSPPEISNALLPSAVSPIVGLLVTSMLALLNNSTNSKSMAPVTGFPFKVRLAVLKLMSTPFSEVKVSGPSAASN